MHLQPARRLSTRPIVWPGGAGVVLLEPSPPPPVPLEIDGPLPEPGTGREQDPKERHREQAFDNLRARVDVDPERRKRVEQRKRAIRDALALGRLRASRDVTQY